ncbi:MAG: hypothetical protein ACO3Q7_10895 [Steroidobacteraceae bacterium]
MAVAFPLIKPTERDYNPPEHAVTRLRSQNGITTLRIWGSAAGNAELILGFRNIHTDKAADIVNAWLATKSGIDTLILPSTVFAGMGTKLKQVILPTQGSLSWTFAERPTVQAVPPIWATVQVRLVGELRMN